MKKVIQRQFGAPDVLELVESGVPEISPQEVLINVRAVSINPLDWKKLSSSMRLMTGGKFPKDIGIDFSGRVVEVGAEVKDFESGDDVFGGVKDPMKEGALAEYTVARPEQLALKPVEISYEQAAAMTSVGAPAIEAFEETVQLHKNDEVLINGASGGVGMIAIQVAKRAGAIVTAVASGEGLEFAKKWGADFSIDYRKEDISMLAKKFDTILELSGQLSFLRARNIMKKDAAFVTLMGAGTIGDLLGGKLGSIFSKRKFHALIAPATKAVLIKLSGYAERRLDIHIGARFPMAEAGSAIKKIKDHGVIGKAVFSPIE